MKQREQGMDRLRILAAFFVVGIHLFALLADLNGGGGAAQFMNAFFYALVFCAVNCFGLLSGWLGYREEGNRLRIASLLLLWMQFVFYRVFFLLLPSLAGLAEPVRIADIVLPVTRRVNWYMSAYFEMMLFAPAINLAVRHAPRRASAAMGLALFGIAAAAALLRTLMDCDPLLLGEGYTWMWLAVLYFWGAAAKKHGWFSGVGAGTLRRLLAASLLLAAGWRVLMQCRFAQTSFPGSTAKLFYSYPSPTAVTAAFCLLLLHARMKENARLSSLIGKASSAALGVFLLHTTVWNWLIAPNARLLRPLPAEWAWVNVLLAALVITLLCIPVDLLRARLFEALRLRQLAGRIQAVIFRLTEQWIKE